MYLLRLKLLRPTVYEEMHLQDNTLFDIDPNVNDTQSDAQCPLHHETYVPAKVEVTTPTGWEDMH